ncbi:glycosyltransferase family 2 protein [Aerosakkonema funiforme]|uniref:Glycosyltransferase family 2 protein n=2 Tax=Oscillatoriophycideae TaxID=1301283 RepID=A0A926VAB3_9CYAN|nr:glycosyltransferase family 2 protein [Aerosakkonema funiforme]MBD2180101.1 glycosyltransferase family 2 protein [Aerosakkonema funiforme FACHB-1375]
MATYDCFVSVVAPLSNDARIVKPFVTEVMEVLRNNYANYELVLVNDGSEDDTAEQVCGLLKEYECIRLLNLSRSFGTDVAISSGLDSVIGDFVAIVLPESDPPDLIPDLIQQARLGYDIVIGIRNNRSGEPLWMKVGAKLFYLSCKSIFKIPLIENATQFRVLSRAVVNAIIQVNDKYRYLRLLSSYVGYRRKTFTYEQIRRYRRPKLKSFLETVDIALQVIVVNSVRPLRFASYLGLLASIFNILYMGYIALVYLFKDQVAEGWVTLSFQNAIAFFCISIVLTILSEYVGFIFERLKGWPAYYIAEEKNSSVLIADRDRRNIVKNSDNIQV